MPVIQYNEGVNLAKSTANGMFTVEASNAIGQSRVKLPAHGFFLLPEDVSCIDQWEGERPIKHDWAKGSVAYLPARSELTCTTEQIYDETLLSLDDRLLIETANSYIERSDVDARFVEVTTSEVRDIVHVLHRMVASGEYQNWPLMTDSLQMALCAAVVRRFAPRDAARADASGTGMSASRQRRAVDFVEANIGNRFNLRDMAGAANLSTYHFSRAFKKATGKTPTRYVRDRRMREAQMLLKSSRMSLAEIALHCGWASQAHFTTTFKQWLGVTPGQFRQTVTSAVTTAQVQFTEPIATIAKLIT